jgi:hypothetical protein
MSAEVTARSPAVASSNRTRSFVDRSGGRNRRAWPQRTRPTDRTLEVLRLRDGAWTIVGFWEDAALVRVEPFEAVELELGRLWGDEAPPPSSAR